MQDVDSDKPAKKAFKPYPIGFFDLDLPELRTAASKRHLFIAIDRTSKFAFARLVERANTETAVAFVEARLAAVLSELVRKVRAVSGLGVDQAARAICQAAFSASC